MYLYESRDISGGVKNMECGFEKEEGLGKMPAKIHESCTAEQGVATVMTSLFHVRLSYHTVHTSFAPAREGISEGCTPRTVRACCQQTILGG